MLFRSFLDVNSIQHWIREREEWRRLDRHDLRFRKREARVRPGPSTLSACGGSEPEVHEVLAKT